MPEFMARMPCCQLALCNHPIRYQCQFHAANVKCQWHSNLLSKSNMYTWQFCWSSATHCVGRGFVTYSHRGEDQQNCQLCKTCRINCYKLSVIVAVCQFLLLQLGTGFHLNCYWLFHLVTDQMFHLNCFLLFHLVTDCPILLLIIMFLIVPS